MQKKPSDFNIPGPFRAEQLKSGDPYELSNGHPIECMPTGGRGSRANLIGGSVLALFDREAAHEATLRNLLQRKGYRDLDQVRDDGRAEGKAEGKVEGELSGLRNAILLVLTERGLRIGLAQRAALDVCDDPAQLQRWLAQVVTAVDAAELFRPSH